MAENSIISYEDIIGKDNTFKVIEKELNDLEAHVLKLAKNLEGKLNVVNPSDGKAIEQYEKKIQELEIALKNLQKQQEITAKAKKQVTEATLEELTAIEAEKIKKREQIAIAKQLAIIQKSEKNSIEAIRAQLALTTLEWKKLTEAETVESEMGRKLTAEKLQLTNQLKKLEKATGDHRREVGNYTLAGNKAAGMVSRLGLAGNKLTGVFGRLGRALDSVGFGAFALAAAGATIAWQFFADNVLSNSDEIIAKNKELKESIEDLSKTLQEGFKEGKLLEIDNSNLSETEKRLKKIAFFAEESGKAQAKLAATANEASELASRISQNSFKTELEKNEAIKRSLELDVERNKLIKDALSAEKEIKNIKEQTNKEAAEARKKEREANDKLKSEISKLQSDRLKALSEVEKNVSDLEAQSIEDKTARLIALEDLRFKEEQALREKQYQNILDLTIQQEAKLKELYGQSSAEFLIFKDQLDKQLLAVEAKNLKESELQVKQSEKNKLEIYRESFEENVKQQDKIKTEQLEQVQSDLDKNNELIKADLKKQQDSINAAYDYEARKNKEKNDKIKENNKELFQSVVDGTQKIGAAIAEMYEKQADVAAKNVEKQASALDDARERARLGLSDNLKFEEEELAKRELERERAQKRAQQVAKLTALFNIVAAGAANGDANAVVNGIVQFGLLTAFEAAIEGSYFEGTEDLGKAKNPLDGKGGRLVLAHDNERIVTKAQNEQLGSMSNPELVENALLGKQLKDGIMPIGADHYAVQSNSIKGTYKSDNNDYARLESKLDEVKKAIIDKPVITQKFEDITDAAVTISTKITTGLMTRNEKIKKRMP